MVRIKVVTPDSLGDIYGLWENYILCKPLENGALEKGIPNLSNCPLTLVIEVWRALPTSPDYLINLMTMPGLNSDKLENPFMFTFPQEEPTTTRPTSMPIMDHSCAGSNGTPRWSPRGQEVPPKDSHSIQDGQNNVDSDIQDVDNDDYSEYIDVDDYDNKGNGGRKHKRGEDDEEEIEVAKIESHRKRSRKDISEANVKENGEDNKNVKVYIKGAEATIADLFTGGRQNITVEGISYSCGIPIETTYNKTTVQYKKVYRCLMVLNKKTKRGGEINWQSIETVQIRILLGVRGGWWATLGRMDIGFG